MFILSFTAGVQVDPDLFLAHATRVRVALQRSDIDQEKACVYMGTRNKQGVWVPMDAAQFHRQLNGEGHLSFTRLMLLPMKFWAWWALLILLDAGMPPEISETRAIEKVVVRGRKRPARMALPPATTATERSA